MRARSLNALGGWCQDAGEFGDPKPFITLAKRRLDGVANKRKRDRHASRGSILDRVFHQAAAFVIYRGNRPLEGLAVFHARSVAKTGMFG